MPTLHHYITSRLKSSIKKIVTILFENSFTDHIFCCLCIYENILYNRVKTTSIVATTDVATTDVATTDVATTDVATTDVATTDVATTDVVTTDVVTTDVATTDVAKLPIQASVQPVYIATFVTSMYLFCLNCTLPTSRQQMSTSVECCMSVMETCC